MGGEKGGKGAGSEREGRAWGMQLVAVVNWERVNTSVETSDSILSVESAAVLA